MKKYEFRSDTEAIGHSSFWDPEICHGPLLNNHILTISSHDSNLSGCTNQTYIVAKVREGDFKTVDKWQLLLLIYDGLGNGLFIGLGARTASAFGLVNQRL